MKIKQLHIRNIASIERGDIDFEHDLTDPLGCQAPLFLICGDTGAGKTVILDCIAMALYGTTPRIGDVSNSARNDYVTTEGETMRVASIEQYTRLGISERDDCYSELLFEGNDGVCYRARLALGMKRERATRLLKHRPPRWSVQVGDADWVEGKTEAGRIIQDAIGISFAQFGRIAMLAQGQFAAFLTGNKSERESILEQLTNTQHFSRCGQAITNIYKRAQEALAQAQAEHDQERTHILTPDEQQRLEAERVRLDGEVAQAGVRLAATERRLKLMAQVVGSREEARRAQADIGRLEEEMRGDAFVAATTLVEGWDATTLQRQTLARRDEARRRHEQCLRHEQQLCRDYCTLVAGIARREAGLRRADADVATRQAWLDGRTAKAALYAKVDLAVSQLQRYADTGREIAAAAKSMEGSSEAVGQMTSRAEACRREAADAARRLADSQEAIDRLRREYEAQQPDSVNASLNAATSRRADLVSLQQTLQHVGEKRRELATVEAGIAAQETAVRELTTALEAAEAALKTARQRSEAATSRLLTMQTSLDEAIVALRRRMADEHAERCPLCGQEIHSISLESDFEAVLLPMEREKQAADSLLGQAQTACEQCKNRHTAALATARQLRRQQTAARAALAAQEQLAAEAAAAMGIEATDGMEARVAASLAELGESIAALTARQKANEQLQRRLSQLMADQKPLQKASDTAAKARESAEKALDKKLADIAKAESLLREKRQAVAELTAELDGLLSEAAPGWQRDAGAAMRQLKAEAADYERRRRELDTLRQALQADRQLMANLTDLNDKVVGLRPAWPEAVADGDADAGSTAASGKADGLDAWTRLYANLNSVVTTDGEASECIRQTEAELEAWYEASGTDEAALTALARREKELAQARIYINGTRASLKSRRDALATATQAAATALTQLEPADGEDEPQLPALEAEKAATGRERDRLLAELAAVRTRLDENSRDQERFRLLAERLERATSVRARWQRLNDRFGGTRFRTLVQSYVMRPLLANANIYLRRITDRYTLTCSDANEQLAILVCDRYNKDQVRSATVLSGGERFMISLALALALSTLNRPDMTVDILFIDEGFGTLDETSLEAVMSTLERLQDIAGQAHRRVGIISHREELEERIPTQVRVSRHGEGRSRIEIAR